MLELFEKEGSEIAKNKTYKVWQTGNHAIELYSQKFTWDKVNYIHQNPVKAGFVKRAEDWSYSSASNYVDSEFNVLDEVCCITALVVTV